MFEISEARWKCHWNDKRRWVVCRNKVGEIYGRGEGDPVLHWSRT